MRIAVDTGGTFTDLIVEDGSGKRHVFKRPTTPDDPVRGIFDALVQAAGSRGETVEVLLSQTDTFIHATTRAINAILTGTTARTAFLCTEGHPDTLLFREGGRIEIFNFTVEYPRPYVPRSLTFEVPERIAHDGGIVKALDEEATVDILLGLGDLGVEAIGVCLLFSTINPRHERRLGELIEHHLPGIPYTLSHVVNPTLREYRRASSTCIDASLKPVMSTYLKDLGQSLQANGFAGRFLVVTSRGGVRDGADVAGAPIHAVNSGPAMAPVAGRVFAGAETGADTVVVADTGGTSFDVSLVRNGRIPQTRETWLGQPFRGHMTGFPSIDVRSIGAGGGSIAWVDSGGMLHVGPQSAGAAPGPACYNAGGVQATVTDAALVTGLIDPAFFLGGHMPLDIHAARDAVERDVASSMEVDPESAALAIMEVATENMVQSIENITIHQGVDPRSAVLVAGGGAAGLNAVAIARRLGCRHVVVPIAGAALSAAGSLMAELGDDFSATLPTSSRHFDIDAVNRVLAELAERAATFVSGPGAGSIAHETTFSAEARYGHQVWEIEVPLRGSRFNSTDDVAGFIFDFHDMHEAMFAVRDSHSDVEIIHWHCRVRCRLRDDEGQDSMPTAARDNHARRVVLAGHGAVEASVTEFAALATDETLEGPAIVESPFTSVVIDPGVSFFRSAHGSLVIELEEGGDDARAGLAARRW